MSAAGESGLAAGRAALVWVTAGMLARNLLRGLVKLLVAGLLAPRAFGVLRSVYSLFQLVASLAEFGLNSALVTFVSAALGRGDQRERDRILQVILCLDAIILLVVFGFGALFAAPITRWALGDETLTVYVRVAFFAVGGQIGWNYLSSYLSAHRAFGKLALFLPSLPALMLVTALVLVGVDRFDFGTGILIYLLAPAAAVALWWLALRGEGLRRPVFDRAWAAKIVRFSRWTFATSLASSVRSNANTLLIKSPRLSGSLAAGEAAAGVYAFGSDLAAEVTVFSESLMAVLLPKAASLREPGQLRTFLGQAYRNLALLLPALALLMFLADPLLRLLGAVSASYLAYLPAIPVFMILYSSALFSIAAIPARTVLYALGLPRFEARVEIVSALLVVAGSILVIPVHGIEGAAWVLFGQRLAVWLILLGYTLARLGRSGSEAG